MKRKLIATLLVLGLMLTFVPMTIFSTSADAWYDAAATDLYVYNETEMMAFGQAIADGKTFEGQTVHIMADIDLGWRNIDPSKPGGTENQPNQVEGQVWPLNTATGKTFSGMIDGHGHTVKGINVSHGSATLKGVFGSYLTPVENFTVGVKNLTITDSFVCGAGESGGLFGRVKTGANDTAKVAFENLLLDIDVYANGRMAGVLAGTCYARSATVSNVVVRGVLNAAGSVNGTTYYNVYAGGFFGTVLPSDTTYKSTVTIQHSVYEGTLTTSYTSATWDWLGMGGFIGVVGGGTNLGGAVTIENCAFYGAIEAKGNAAQQVGGFIGKTMGGCTSVINATNLVACGYMSTLTTNSIGNSGIILGILASNATFNLTNAVGRIKAIDANHKAITTNGVGTVPCASNKTDRWWSIQNAVEGPDMFAEPAQSSLVYTYKSGAEAFNLNDTFVATTGSKPLPMGVVNFYADQFEGVGANSATYAYGKQATEVDENGKFEIRVIGLLKDVGERNENGEITSSYNYEGVGLDIVAIRKDGTVVKYADKNDILDGASDVTQNIYTSLMAGGEVVETKDLEDAAAKNYKYFFTVCLSDVSADSGILTLVVRSFHEVDGARVYDDTRVINFNTAADVLA